MNPFWSMIIHSLFPTVITAAATLYSIYFANTRGKPFFYVIAAGLAISSLHQLAEIETWLQTRTVPAPDWWFGDFPETILVLMGVVLTFFLADYFERVDNLLDEKDVLLAEIHHRVKNNLQTIQSLLSIEKSKLSEPEAKKTIQRSNRRIRSIARVHEHLYQSKNVRKLDVSEYFHELTEELENAFSGPYQTVELNTQIEPIDLSLSQAIACGLCLNELVSNAYQHAFGEENGQINVILRRTEQGRKQIVVEDDGRGLSEAENAPQGARGLSIVKRLVKHDLNGSIDFNSNDGGLRSAITFP